MWMYRLCNNIEMKVNINCYLENIKTLDLPQIILFILLLFEFKLLSVQK